MTSKDAYILVDSAPGAAVWELIITSTSVYRIGDTGPAGGVVFYISDGGFHGLEAAPSEQGSAVWGCAGTAITGADRTDINAGSTNTGDILEGCATTGIASRLADNYSLNGFNDWFLPSKDQLNELYLKRNTIGADPFIYWSSSEVSGTVAWGQSFINGSLLNFSNNKFGALRVLPIRAF